MSEEKLFELCLAIGCLDPMRAINGTDEHAVNGQSGEAWVWPTFVGTQKYILSGPVTPSDPVVVNDFGDQVKPVVAEEKIDYSAITKRMCK